MTRIFDPPRRDLNLPRNEQNQWVVTSGLAYIRGDASYNNSGCDNSVEENYYVACTSASADRIFCNSGSGLDLPNRRLIRGISTHSFLGIDREVSLILKQGTCPRFSDGGRGLRQFARFPQICDISRAFARETSANSRRSKSRVISAN